MLVWYFAASEYSSRSLWNCASLRCIEVSWGPVAMSARFRHSIASLGLFVPCKRAGNPRIRYRTFQVPRNTLLVLATNGHHTVWFDCENIDFVERCVSTSTWWLFGSNTGHIGACSEVRTLVPSHTKLGNPSGSHLGSVRNAGKTQQRQPAHLPPSDRPQSQRWSFLVQCTRDPLESKRTGRSGRAAPLS